jgi:hypothetical protein
MLVRVGPNAPMISALGIDIKRSHTVSGLAPCPGLLRDHRRSWSVEPGMPDQIHPRLRQIVTGGIGLDPRRVRRALLIGLSTRSGVRS